MGARERRLQLWLRIWAPIFGAGALGFYLTPDMVTAHLNRHARTVGLEEAPVDADNLWVVLAMAYMVLITGLSQSAAREPLKRQDLVRFLMLGKAASSLGALGYFLGRRRSFAFLANFLLDGAIFVTTYRLLSAAQAE